MHVTVEVHTICKLSHKLNLNWPIVGWYGPKLPIHPFKTKTPGSVNWSKIMDTVSHVTCKMHVYCASFLPIQILKLPTVLYNEIMCLGNCIRSDHLNTNKPTCINKLSPTSEIWIWQSVLQSYQTINKNPVLPLVSCEVCKSESNFGWNPPYITRDFSAVYNFLNLKHYLWWQCCCSSKQK